MDAGQEQIELGGRKIRQQSISRRERMRPLLDASSEVISGTFRSNDDSASVFWLNAAAGQLLASAPSEEEMETGGVVPVLTYSGAHSEELARKQACPSCGENDAIRFLGSSIATLLSVAISNLFGMGDLDSARKNPWSSSTRCKMPPTGQVLCSPGRAPLLSVPAPGRWWETPRCG